LRCKVNIESHEDYLSSGILRRVFW